ncbi:MAG: hypothetical protein ACP5SI_06980 [Chloroflexia bacterium]
METANCDVEIYKDEEQVVSFLVRIWREPGSRGWECRGWVQHIQTGTRSYFHGLPGLSKILAAYLGVASGKHPNRDRRRLRDRIAAWFGGQE